MKRFLLTLGILVAVGAGCFGQPPVEEASPTDGWNTYLNTEYGFGFDHPTNFEVHSRPTEQRPDAYVGLDVSFFASLRDTARGEKTENVAHFYAAKDVELEAFTAALTASDPGNITIKETTDIDVGGVAMTKIVSTTALGIDKTHYLYRRVDTLIIISVILSEEEAFAPVLETFRLI
jgi:hypothetical protein